MLLKLSVPYLAEVKEVLGYPVWVTSAGKWGTLVALSQLDSEAVSLLPIYQRMGEYFRQLPTGVKLRFFSKTKAHYEDRNHFRINEINEIGSLNTELLMSIEFSHSFVSVKSILHKTKSLLTGNIDFSVNEFEVKALLSKVDLGALSAIGLNPVPASIDQVKDLWPWEDLQIGDYGQNLDLGPSLLTTLRLWKPGIYPISSSTLSEIKTKLFDEVDFVVSIQKVGEAKSTLRLNRKQKQASAGNSLVDAIQNQDAEQQLSEALLEGSTHFEVEWLAVLQRSNEERLRQDALTLSRELRQLGDIYQETVGSAESFVASLPGSETIQTFTEKDYHLPYYLPIASQGVSQKDIKEVALHSLCVGRRDGSLDYIDFWQRSNSNFSAIIGGASGKGKTVLLQMLLSALHHNPEMRITNVDAGGSSLLTCKKLGAEIHDLNLGQSSGINPFEWISVVDDLSFLDQTLSTFLGTLILEEREVTLAKELKATLEREVYKYIRSQKLGHFNGVPTQADGKDLSMEGFLLQLPKEFPRRILFERWAKGGKFAEIIKTKPNQKTTIFSKSHHCYNFTSIDQAADKDFAQAAGALVLAQANLESWRAKQIPGLIYAQVFDETKFLFRRCIEQFLLLIANVRKLGQSIVLVNQDTSDFLVPSGISESRLTIFNNCQTHILFYDESKGETREEVMQKGEESFPGRHGLNEREYQLVRSLQGNPPFYSEFLIKDGRGTRVSRLALTPNEYWRVTSDAKDLSKKNKLKQALPELTEEEIIQWMIRTDLKSKEKSLMPGA